jgi:hypothetical protein
MVVFAERYEIPRIKFQGRVQMIRSHVVNIHADLPSADGTFRMSQQELPPDCRPFP